MFKQAGRPKKQAAVIVLGMHRSGTSALAGALSTAGVGFGDGLIPATKDNEKGYFEHRQIVELHEKLLQSLGSDWDDIRALPKNWHERLDVVKVKAQLKKIIETNFTDMDLWGIKDPRQSRLLPLWFCALDELEIQPQFAIIFRNPEEVVRSLKKRDEFEEKKGLLLWLVYNLEIERYTRGHERGFINYDTLLNNPDKSLQDLSQKLSLDKIPNDITQDNIINKIKQFLSPKLKHQVSDSQDIAGSNADNDELYQWANKVYGIFNDFSTDINGKLNESRYFNELDKIFSAVNNKIKDAEPVIEPWIKETFATRYKLHKSYTDIHKKNLQLIEESNARKAEKDKLETLVKTLEERVRNLQFKSDRLYNELDEERAKLQRVFNSKSWKITAPLRKTAKFYRFFKVKLISAEFYRKIYIYIRENGLIGFIKQSYRHLVQAFNDKNDFEIAEYTNRKYLSWIDAYDNISEIDEAKIKQHIANFKARPLISVVMPVYNVDEKWLRQAIDSVLGQLYQNFELCIADDSSPKPHIKRVLSEYLEKDERIKVTFREQNGNISECSNSALALATGDFVALMDHDDLLPEHALYMIANEINEHQSVDLIYSDEDKISQDNIRNHPFFKPDFDEYAILSRNIFSHFGVYRTSLIRKAGGFRRGFEGSQDHDLILRCLLHTEASKIRHIPHILYHWRTIPGSTAVSVENKDYALEASKKAVTEYVNTIDKNAEVEQYNILGVFGPASGIINRVRWSLPDPTPKVSVIIPTRNGYKLLKSCIKTIQAKTKYPDYEIIIVDNQSDDKKALGLFSNLQKENNNIKVIKYDAAFNYSAINNFAVSHASGEVIALLNNDVEVINEDWLIEMVSLAMKSKTGAVGAKLYYPNGKIQHAGILTGAGASKDAVGWYYSHNQSMQNSGYFGFAKKHRLVAAVTAACMVMRKSVFNEVNGFDEKNLAVAFNDVDLCLRLREKGYQIVWTPYAEICHHESATRGKEDTTEKFERFKGEVFYMRNKWGKILDNDPYYSPNLDLTYADYTLASPPRVKKPWG